ncbi:lysophospholipid acyltransferase family protein [Novosphingobium mangrovi (ex Huang et al. 2023)]|uniref:1-acyl-sn-glycerol-3-phosphate acyltransferase n=1 Tax=Novosphingobium mangrovi (ex Huang et al. 2023) TaxID=2976432 RepID=A0ABT2I4B6_9SPHN|nr:lysophospholipid acyltransferase family protein [Novosphingobium mangrovi (ex Huang et al. 2023)]MCT2399646.1 1-acyl-sn-glycerol-3-phosphate acyltransferase [Novosphingobium mangrovi (ex Huang et al. 2023)]
MTRAASTPAPARGRTIAPWNWPLVAMRLALLLATLLLCTPLYYLLAPLTARNPVPRWFLRAVTAIAGVRLRIVGVHPAGRTFFLANHVSWLDIPAMAGATGTAFIAHDGLAAFGPLRWLCGLNDTVFIARHDRRSVAAQVEQVRSALFETGALTIFPEGTTSDGTALLPFKSSLLSALEAEADADQIPVQPVWLDYGEETRDIAWAGAEPGLDNALRILARWRPVRLAITFLPLLQESERVDRKAMAHAASHAISAAMATRRG